MRRRWLILLELVALTAMLVWVGLSLAGPGNRPPNAIDLKVQMQGAEDRVYLVQGPDGELRYQVTLDDGSVQQLAPGEFARQLFADQRSRGWLEVLLNVSSPAGFLWVTLGLLGQLLFTGRMVVQWLISEKSKRSVVPPAFWWMSLVGATMLLVYFLWRKEPIGVLGQATGWFIYVRNLWLIYQKGPGASAVSVAEDPAPEPELGR
ncbi:MAG TPA: lipid-A-disaccharide synthase N-terminal domain-containing protein [Planctomycetota bacterium]|nr:lipid-A-disaccharide synthase N-terminal domain-containing protein [Planctomycetota bacterium]